MITKFVKDDQFIMFEYDVVTDTTKVTASSDDLIAKYDEFCQREQEDDNFFADVDGLEDELKFVRQ